LSRRNTRGIIGDESLSAQGRPSPGSRQLCVILKTDGDEIEIGSIGIRHGAAWRWGIDTLIPMPAATRHHLTQTRISSIMARSGSLKGVTLSFYGARLS
jgi:hypothetical protein